MLGYADLSDVVEERAKVHGGDLVGTEAESLRDRQRVLHRGCGVALGRVILRGERPEKRCDHRVVRCLESLRGSVQAFDHGYDSAGALAVTRRYTGDYLQ